MNVTEKININNCSDIELDNFINANNHLPDSYAIEFSPWAEIIGYEVDENNVKEYGLENILVPILYELTFFGFSEEDKEPQKEELKEAIKEFEEISKMPEEEQKKYYIPISDMLDDWGYKDNRTK